MLAIFCLSALNRTRRALPPSTRFRLDGMRAKFLVRPGVGALAILVDNDEIGIGQHRAIESEVLRVIPRRSGDDLNDSVPKWGVA